MTKGLPILVAYLGLALLTAASSAPKGEHQPAWKKVELHNSVYYVVPFEVLRSLGLVCEDIPEEQNAATWYLRATKAVPFWPALDFRSRGRHNAALREYRAAMASPWDPEEGNLFEWFKETAQGRRLFRKAASMKRCQFPIASYEPGEVFLIGSGKPAPLGSGIRELVDLMLIEGHLLEHEGKTREALEPYLSILPAAYHWSGKSNEMEWWQAVVWQAMARDAIRKCIRRNEMTKESLQWLAAELADAERFMPERAAWLARARAEAVQVAGMTLDELASLAGPPPCNEALLAFYHSRAFRILWPARTLRKDTGRFYDTLGGLMKNPLRETLGMLKKESWDDFSRRHLKDWNLIAWTMRPRFERDQVLHGRNICDQAALRIEVALRLYRAEHGEYPASLRGLVPDYMKELPPDPFSGKPLHYRRHNGEWTLYSVGADQKDDGAGQEERYDPDIVYWSWKLGE